LRGDLGDLSADLPRDLLSEEDIRRRLDLGGVFLSLVREDVLLFLSDFGGDALLLLLDFDGLLFEDFEGGE